MENYDTLVGTGLEVVFAHLGDGAGLADKLQIGRMLMDWGSCR